MKVLTENLALESGASAPEAYGMVEAECPAAKPEPILRLMAASENDAPPEPPPILLTAVVQARHVEPEDQRWNGAALRRAREVRGVTLAQLADRTKVTRHHLENIEADRYDLLPPYIYLRGILLSIARELKVDGQRVARTYLELAQQAQQR